MKALTLTQPWATLVAIGAKAIETRGWQTRYRGPLAIHAAKGMPRDVANLCYMDPFRSALRAGGYDLGFGPGHEPEQLLPRGAIVAVATLVGIEPTDVLRSTTELVDLARSQGGAARAWFNGVEPAGHELAFGDYSAGRFGWLLGEVRALPEPIPCRGYQSLWDVPPAIVAQIEAQLAGVAHV